MRTAAARHQATTTTTRRPGITLPRPNRATTPCRMRARRAWTTSTTPRQHPRMRPGTAMRAPIDLWSPPMNPTAASFTIALALAIVPPAMAQATQSHAHHPAAAASADVDVPAAATAAVAVAERFNTALSSGDLATVESLLAANVLILESGGAERSREEYMGHHAISDAAFLKDAHRQLLRQRARAAGEFAWVGTESELHAQKDGEPLTVQSTETMVLKQTADGWRIVHIHWSSRTRR